MNAFNNRIIYTYSPKRRFFFIDSSAFSLIGSCAILSDLNEKRRKKELVLSILLRLRVNWWKKQINLYVAN